jgi:hypothetical protein
MDPFRGVDRSEVPMSVRWMLVVVVAGTTASAAQGQTPWQFHWEKGQTLVYQVRHDTTVTEVVDGRTQEFKSQLDLRKRYRVTEVNDQGIATLEYSVIAMRNEQTRPNGDVLRFDSADASKSTPGLREQLSKFVGTTLAVLRIDARGRVVAVTLGQASRYAAEPPFTLVLPGTPFREGQSWARSFELIMEPPLGTGEKHAAQQEFRCTKLAAGTATIAVKTAFTKMPEAVQEQMPLVQKEPQGEVLFDVTAGRVAEVRLTIDRTLANHQGPGSSYRFQSSYTEKYLVE